MKNETKRKTLSPAIARVGTGAAYGSTRRKSLTEATHTEHGQKERRSFMQIQCGHVAKGQARASESKETI